MNLAYEFAEYMPGSVSFAMDGSGNHYIFDMRETWRSGEYPLLFADSGDLGYEDCVHVADSLPELRRGTEEIECESDFARVGEDWTARMVKC